MRRFPDARVHDEALYDLARALVLAANGGRDYRQAARISTGCCASTRRARTPPMRGPRGSRSARHVARTPSSIGCSSV